MTRALVCVFVAVGTLLAQPALSEQRPVVWTLQKLLTEPARLVLADVVAVDREHPDDIAIGYATMRVVRVYRGSMEHEVIRVPEYRMFVGCGPRGTQYTPGTHGTLLLIGLADEDSETRADDGMPIVPTALWDPAAYRTVGLGSGASDETILALMTIAEGIDKGKDDGVAEAQALVVDRLMQSVNPHALPAWFLLEALTEGLVSVDDENLRTIASSALEVASRTADGDRLSAVGGLIGMLRERGMMREFLRPIIALCDHPSQGQQWWSNLSRSARWSVAWFAEQHGLEFDKNRGAWEQLDVVVALLAAAERGESDDAAEPVDPTR